MSRSVVRQSTRRSLHIRSDAVPLAAIALVLMTCCAPAEEADTIQQTAIVDAPPVAADDAPVPSDVTEPEPDSTKSTGVEPLLVPGQGNSTVGLSTTSPADESLLTNPPSLPQFERTDSDQLRLEKQERFDRLSRQLRLLEEAWKYGATPLSPTCQQPRHTDPGASSSDPGNGSPRRSASRLPDLRPDGSAVTSPRNGADLPSQRNQSANSPVPPPAELRTPVNAGPVRPEEGSRTGTSERFVVDGPVDRLGLADSLFATGEIVQALELYTQLDRNTLTPEQIRWIDYQQATCYRRLGQPQEAEKRYRDLISRDRSDWIDGLCRWWLTEIDDRCRLEANSAKLQSILDTLNSELENELTRAN